jgi:predicted dehydrogenase
MNALEYFDPSADHPRAWLLRPSIAGGGPMKDFGCHRIEVLLNLFGTVHSAAGLITNAVFDREVEDTAAVVLRFDAGQCATVAVTHGSHERHDTLHVFGTRGAIHVDNLNAGTIRVRTDSERVEQHPPAANVHRPLIDDFVAAVREHREPAVTGETGRAVAAIEDVIYAVAPSGG